MNTSRKIIGIALACAMALGFMAVPSSAMAQSRAAKRERTHRITASALGAAGIYAISRKQTTLGAIALAGSAYEAKRMQDSINKRHRQARLAAYRRGYRNGTRYAMNRSRTRTGSSYRWVKGKDGKYHRVRGTAWAATRGRKVGWTKNGKA